MRALTLAVVLVAGSASAVPAPMSAEDLARADLVVDAKVDRVECAGPPVDKGDFVVTEYRSSLTIEKTVSGKPPSALTLSGYRIEWKEEQPTGAPPTPPLAKGWRGRLYLDELGGGGGFVPVWYNALVEDPSASRPEALPKCGARGCSGCALPDRESTSWLAMVLVGLLLVARRTLTRSSNAGSLPGSSSRRAGARLPRPPVR